MKEYANIIWQNLFLKTFDYKGKANKREYTICNIFYWILFTTGAFALGAISALIDDYEILPAIYGLFLLYLRLVPFTALRVRRLHDIGEKGTKLILIYIVAIIAPLGLGFIWLMSHMYEKSVDSTQQSNTSYLEPTQLDSIKEDIELEDVEL